MPVGAACAIWLATDPRDPRNLVGVWQQDVYSTRSARGALAAHSSNGGASWRTVPLPFTGCAPAPFSEPSTGVPYDAVYDNWVSAGPDGTFYTTALAGSSTTFSNGVVAAVSHDGGATWTSAQAIIDSIQDSSGQHKVFNDKAAVTADPTRAGTAYVVWDQLEWPHTFSSSRGAFRGPTFFSATVDAGRSWSAPRAIFDPGEMNQTIGNEVVVANGVLYDFFDLMSSTGTTGKGGGVSTATHVAFVTSSDGGQTWSAAQIVGRMDTVGVTDPVTGSAVTSGGISAVAPLWDPASGRLYVAWQDGDLAGGRWDEIAYSVSSDLGSTWSAPAQVNTSYGGPAFNPALAVARDGTVAVSYYDFRNLPPGDSSTLPTNVWLKKLPVGATSFGADTAVWPADQPFDLARAPLVSGGYFLGDYHGMVASVDGFVSLFGAVGSDPSDIFSVSGL